MHPVVNHLIQLQELNMIRDEQKVIARKSHLEQLDASIKGMTAKLPGDIKQLYTKLLQRDPIVVAPVSGSICAACGMTLPISLIQSVKQAREVKSCPNCARMLYAQEQGVRRQTAGRRRRTGPQPTGISRFSSQSLMIPKLSAVTREDAIQELGLKMAREGYVDNGERLVEGALRREAIVSTAVDKGLAFPHVRGVEGGGLAMALGISRDGIAWDSPDGKPTEIVFFLAIPMSAAAFYLKLLAGLTETFMKSQARQDLLAETDPAKLWKALCKVTRRTVK